MKQFLLISLFIISFIFILYVFISADQGKLPQFLQQFYHFPLGDKIGHLLLMGLFALIIQSIAIKICKRRQTQKIILISSLVLGIILTIEECSQLILPTRNFSFLDLTFTYLGIILATILNITFWKHRSYSIS